MKRIPQVRRLYVVCAFVLVAVVVLASPLSFSRRLRTWVALSQNPPARFEAHVYVTYQFNTLKKPTGLLWVSLAPNGARLFIADSGNHVVRSFNPGANQLNTVAGMVGSAGYVNGLTSSARFAYPTGISGHNMSYGSQTGCNAYNQWGACISPQITYYNAQALHINDSQNFVVRKICVGDYSAGFGECAGAMGMVSTIGGNHNKGYWDGAASSASFASLGGHSDVGGSCYMVDAENHCIRAMSGGTVSTFAGSAYPGFVDGYRTNARFNVPGKMTADGTGNMYVADIGNNAIRKIDPSGYVTTRAGGGPFQFGKVDAQGSAATFFRPTAVVSNPADGMLYVADSHNNCIRRIDSAGNVTTYAGTGAAGLVNGDRLQAQFSMPTDLVIFGGFMYIADSLNNCIRRIDMSNGQVSTYIS